MLCPNRPVRRVGFTLIELLIVVIIIAILIALLLPVIVGAVQTARNAAVASEINNMAQALADFKTRYGDYPPSRIILTENGALDTTSTVALGSVTWYTSNATQPPIAGAGFYGADITYGTLAQRSLRFMRKFWPRAQFTANGTAIAGFGPTSYYDFNGNFQYDAAPILLEGHEALVFFLGGIPNVTQNSSGGFVRSMQGFGKRPENPFVNANATNYPRSSGTNRIPPFFEFRSDRLVDNDGDGMPGYVDTLATGPDARYYAYFASYGNGSYDPNDVNFPEINQNLGSGFIGRAFLVNFQVPVQFFNPNWLGSPAPNPYTNSLPVPLSPPNTVVYQNPETFQIISAGRDGLYGAGGQYQASSTNDRLPIPDATAQWHTGASPPANLDANIRQVERDNITNFSTSRLD